MKKIKPFQYSKLLIDDQFRRYVMYQWLSGILAVVAFLMTLLNFLTGEYILMRFTLAFGVVSLADLFLCRKKLISQTILNFMIGIEALIMFTFFIVSGIPNGFSTLWFCMIPLVSFVIYGVKSGGIFSTFVFFEIIFFFWIPFGKNLLQFEYTNEFMQRFPFFYLAVMAVCLLVELFRAKTQEELIEAKNQYENLHKLDALTGVYNRYEFNNIMAAAFAKRTEYDLSLMLIDIDDFKVVNDTYGHDFGDVVLKGIANIITNTLCEHCSCCRWGGEEFVTLFQCEHNPFESAEMIRKKVEEMVLYSDDTPVQVTISIGIAKLAPQKVASLKELFRMADKSLYNAKANGKNCIVESEIE